MEVMDNCQLLTYLMSLKGSLNTRTKGRLGLRNEKENVQKLWVVQESRRNWDMVSDGG